MKKVLNFDGKVVLVTGSTRNLGEAIACLFAKYGATVIINCRHEEDINRVTERIKSSGGVAFGIRADVGNIQEVESMIHLIEQKFGRLDALVNNAVLHSKSSTESLNENSWNAMFQTNLLGPFYVLRAASDIMRKHKSGSIINLISPSVLGIKLREDIPQDSLDHIASKGALISFTKALAKRLGEFNIRVNAVMPLWVLSESAKRWIEGHKIELNYENLTLRRLPTPEDVAYVCLFLASDMSTFVSSEIIALGGIPKPDMHFLL